MYFTSPTRSAPRHGVQLDKQSKTKDNIYVLELKVDDTVDNALAQIDSKGYAIPYEADGRTLTKCGVTISSEARNITHWRAVDNDGMVIYEQKF